MVKIRAAPVGAALAAKDPAQPFREQARAYNHAQKQCVKYLMDRFHANDQTRILSLPLDGGESSEGDVGEGGRKPCVGTINSCVGAALAANNSSQGKPSRASPLLRGVGSTTRRSVLGVGSAAKKKPARGGLGLLETSLKAGAKA